MEDVLNSNATEHGDDKKRESVRGKLLYYQELIHQNEQEKQRGDEIEI